MIGIIKVHAGDFSKNGCHHFMNNYFLLETASKKFGLINDKREKKHISSLAEIAIASEENVKKMAGTVGWGIAGGLVFGPAGLLAGLLMGGKKKEVTFVAKFKDNRKMLATTDNKTYLEISAAHWDKVRNNDKSHVYQKKNIDTVQTLQPSKRLADKSSAEYESDTLIRCPACDKGIPSTAVNCPICGHQLLSKKMLKQSESEKLATEVVLVIIFLLLFFPVGFWILWRSKRIKKRSKVFWTTIFIVLVCARIIHLYFRSKFT